MNERIRELYIQTANETADGKEWAIGGLHNVEKFTELIVKECAEICMEMATKCAGLEGDGALAKDCAYWIKRDFGVEE